MSDIWERFRDKPRNRVDEYVYRLAAISADDPVQAKQAAPELCPAFSDAEVRELVNLNLDLIRPENRDLKFDDWCQAWSDGLYNGIRAVGAPAKDPLLERVVKPGRDCARLMYFSAALKSIAGQNHAARQRDLRFLAKGIQALDYTDVFETSDLNDWMRDLAVALPESGEEVLDALRQLWFSQEQPDTVRIEDYSDADHDAFSLATAIVYFALWHPGYADYIADDLKRIARNDFFPVTLNPDDPEDSPPEGAGRRVKLQAMVGAAFAMLEREPREQSWLDLCLSYAQSPSQDTQDAFAQWRPVVAEKFPRATRLIDRALA